jgi:hypothetical protein
VTPRTSAEQLETSASKASASPTRRSEWWPTSTLETAKLTMISGGPPAAKRALGRLQKTLAAHAAGDGVWFDARAWIVKARSE